MKKKLFLSLLMVLAMPLGVKAFDVNAAGFCNQANNPNGTQQSICYVNSTRNITFITSNEATNNNYFCLDTAQTELGPATYTYDKQYVDRGYACAVHNLLNTGAIHLSDLESGVYSFNPSALPGINTSNYTVTNVSGKALTYFKLQMEIWKLNESSTCNKYVENVNPQIALTNNGMQLTTDGNYYYSKITVTKNPGSYNIALADAPTGTILVSDIANPTVTIATTNSTLNEFYLLVPAASATTANVKITLTHNYTVGAVSATVDKYVTTKADNQNLGKLTLNITNQNKSISNYTKVSLNPTVDLEVCKVDKKTRLPMGGVEFKVTSKDGSVTYTLPATDANTGCTMKENVALLEYKITEITTKAGYVKLTTDTDLNCTSVIPGGICTVTIENQPIKIVVKKLDDSGNPLPGALMKLIRRDGTENGTVLDTWESEEAVRADHEITELAVPGKYTLYEEESPSGYVISTQVDFEISETGYKIGEATSFTPFKDSEDGKTAIVTVEMVDEPTKVTIAKVDPDGNPVVGASLKVEDADGNTIVEWVSGDTPYEIKNLKFGTYYLVEVAAPPGYVLNTEKIEFTISQTSVNEQVTFTNIPDTIANKSALLISFAMIDISLGICIILYVTKRKEREE